MKICFILQQRKGTSIVSVMVAFVILMFGILMITVAMTNALKLTNQAAANREVTEEALLKYYTDREQGDSIAFVQNLIFEPQDSIDAYGNKLQGQKGTLFAMNGADGVSGPVGYEYTYKLVNRFGENKFVFYYFETPMAD